MKAEDCFGMLKVTSDKYRENRRTYFTVLCCCGNSVKMRDDHIRKKRHCGCLTADLLKWCKRTHGLCYTGEYFTWGQMWARCTNQNHASYHNYGGRGISVCDRWASFENFIEDMGMRPEGTCEIDRKNNDLGYFPENCHWTTRKVNSRNTRRNVVLVHEGKSQTTAAWAEEIGLEYHVIANRVRSRWSDEEAITSPINQEQSRRAKLGQKKEQV